jgi:uncharacterized protein YbjT (DUF2867 family)
MARRRLLILGGNGYVGQNVCHAAIQSGRFDVVRSLNRSGMPSPSNVPNHLHSSLLMDSSVEWFRGDIFDESALRDAMSDIDVVASCVGAFGTNDHMQRICGDATITAIKCAAARETVGGSPTSVNVGAFAFVSSARVYEGSMALRLPRRAPMYGYFDGKRRAEEELISSFPHGHVILRPGFIYGRRNVGGRTVPLQCIGKPMDYFGRNLGYASTLLQSLPFVGEEISSMVPVESVANATIGSLLDAMTEGGKRGVILDAESIRKY